MMKLLTPLLLVLSPLLTYVLITTVGKDFTTARGSSAETLFPYAESYLLQVETLGIDLSSLKERLDEKFGWCTKHKLIIKPAAPIAPRPLPTSPTPNAPAAPAVSNSTGGVVAVAQAPVNNIPPPTPENIRNILYAEPVDLPLGFEIFCQTPDGDKVSLINQMANQSTFEIQRFLKQPLIKVSEKSSFELSSKGKFSVVLSTNIGDLLVQSTAPASLVVYTDKSKLNLTSKMGKILLSLYRATNDPRLISPIRINTMPNSSLQWLNGMEIKNGQYSDLLPNGPTTN